MTSGQVPKLQVRSSQSLRAMLVVLGLVGTTAVGCGQASSPPVVDAGSDLMSQLSLSIAVNPPLVSGLGPVLGQLELHNFGVIADVTNDARTTLPLVQLHLPNGSLDTVFPDAPYGLYSHVAANLDEVSLQTTWRGTPVLLQIEGEYLSVDLLAPAQEYGPSMSAHLGVQLDMSGWFDPARLDAAVLDQGVILIDFRHNAGIAAAMASAIQASFSLAPSAS